MLMPSFPLIICQSEVYSDHLNLKLSTVRSPRSISPDDFHLVTYLLRVILKIEEKLVNNNNKHSQHLTKTIKHNSKQGVGTLLFLYIVRSGRGPQS